MILYLRVLPGFGLAVEALTRPDLLTHPAVLSDGGERGTVREVTSLARRSGVQPGITLAQAKRICPDVLVLMADLAAYNSVWQEICEILGTYTPLVEPVEMGQAVCDLTGCERHWPDAITAAQTVQHAVFAATGILPYLGAARSRIVAELASSRMEDRITVISPDREREFLAPLPITLLPEVDERLDLSFRVLGLRTIGQLAALPGPAVRQRFGAVGERLYRYAQGIDSRLVVPPPARQAVSGSYICEDGTLEEALAALHQLADWCAAELQQRSLAGKLLELTLEWNPLTPSPPLPLWERGRLQSGLPDRPLDSVPSDEEPTALPVPYRIHSMLPQPGSSPAGTALALRDREGTSPAEKEIPAPSSTALALREANDGRLQRGRLALRVSVDAASSLEEHAQRLLCGMWQSRAGRKQQLYGMTLAVSEFEAPTQLAFDEFNRIDQTGALRGLAPDRRQALLYQEQVFAGRHGSEPFLHLGLVDPSNILTERRFRWETGLPSEPARNRKPPAGRKASAGSKSVRRNHSLPSSGS